jgi:hypothetical protein
MMTGWTNKPDGKVIQKKKWNKGMKGINKLKNRSEGRTIF